MTLPLLLYLMAGFACYVMLANQHGTRRNAGAAVALPIVMLFWPLVLLFLPFTWKEADDDRQKHP